MLLLSILIPMTSSYETNKLYYIHIDENGTLSGYVKDTSMNPIEGATIRLSCGENYFENFSDSSGYYYIDNIPIVYCLWNVSASEKGYKTIWAETSIGENTTLDFVLMPFGKTLYVGGDNPGNYTRIQDAIDNASNGDTVFVYNGAYYENIFIDKTIDLIGENVESTFIIDDFSHSSFAITIEINNVTISHFTIIGEAVAHGIYVHSDQTRIIDNIILTAGILINSGNNTITNNYIDSGGSWGIGFYPVYSSFNKIINNTIITNGIGMYLLGSCKNNSILHNTINAGTSGIRLLESNKNIIKDNIMSEGGFHLQDSYDNIILNNSVNEKPICYLYNESDISLNKDYGQIIIINSENITIEHQYIFDLRTGIHLYCSKNCKIINNTITHNHPVRGNGIDILYCENTRIINNNLTYLDAIDVDYSDYTLISYNTIVNCRTGISLKYCNNTVISKNNIVNNSLHIDFYFGSRNSVITMNNLIGNGPYALFIDPINANNTWYNNYWGRPKILPKIILGQLIIKDEYPFPSLMLWIKFDWHPSKEPYDMS